ncbi:MAG: class I SAM-dependent methyltransferase [Halarsenatibacteraceae bacterium]
MSTDNKSYQHSFASIYDQVMAAVPYDFWYEYFKLLLEFHRVELPEQALELGCGTGNMMVRFLREGIRVDGLDGSRDMLAEAKKKVKNFEIEPDFYHQDFLELPGDRQYQLVYSVFDSLNYLLELEKLEQVFKSVCNILDKSGVFIFDLNTEERLARIKPGTTTFQEDDFLCYWQDIVQPEEAIWKVNLMIQKKNESGCYEETHVEKGYNPYRIVESLKAAGFKSVFFYRANYLIQGKPSDDRIYFLAFPEKAGEPGFMARLYYKLKLLYLRKVLI